MAEELTAAIVKNRIDYGPYETKFPTKPGQSSAYDVIQKIFQSKNGPEIKYWFWCTRCLNVLYCDTRDSTQSLLRHKNIYCPKIPNEQRQQAREAEAARRRLNRANRRANSNAVQVNENEIGADGNDANQNIAPIQHALPAAIQTANAANDRPSNASTGKPANEVSNTVNNQEVHTANDQTTSQVRDHISNQALNLIGAPDTATVHQPVLNASSSNVFRSFTFPPATPLSESQLDVLAEYSNRLLNIGCFFGPIPKSTLKQYFENGQHDWNFEVIMNSIEKIAKERSGIDEPRVMLGRLNYKSVQSSSGKSANIPSQFASSSGSSSTERATITVQEQEKVIVQPTDTIETSKATSKLAAKSSTKVVKPKNKRQLNDVPGPSTAQRDAFIQLQNVTAELPSQEEEPKIKRPRKEVPRSSRVLRPKK